MDTQIVAELRVERGHNNTTLPTGHRPSTVNGGEYLNPFTDPLDDRGPDEYRMHLVALDTGDRKVRLERIVLATEGIATNIDVDGSEGSLISSTIEDATREQNHPGTGPERRHPIIETLAQRIEQSVQNEQFGNCRGLPARQHQRVDKIELCWSANLDRVNAEPGQRSGVKVNCSL
jgi:hypothetical protein